MIVERESNIDNPIEIEIDSELEINNSMEDSFTYLNRLYEEAKLKQVKNEVLGDLRNELKTIIENQFKEFCHETSRRKQSNDVIALLKEEWLPLDTNSENIHFTLDAPPKRLNLSTPSQSMLKKERPTHES